MHDLLRGYEMGCTRSASSNIRTVATSPLALRWMCDSPRTGCAWRTTPIYMWREQATIEWSWHVISIVTCYHSAKVCAHAARDFRSQQNGAVTRTGARRGECVLYRVVVREEVRPVSRVLYRVDVCEEHLQRNANGEVATILYHMMCARKHCNLKLPLYYLNTLKLLMNLSLQKKQI